MPYIIPFILLLLVSCQYRQRISADEQARALAIVKQFTFRQGAVDSSTARLNSEELAMLQTGDILLRKGKGQMSQAIAEFLDETYPITHCAFIYIDSASNYWALHCKQEAGIDGICQEPLQQYLGASCAQSCIAVRWKAGQISSLNAMNSVRLLAKQGIPFDREFNHLDSSKLYCAELLWNVLSQEADRDVLPLRCQQFGKEVIAMKNFLREEEFELIFNQFAN